MRALRSRLSALGLLILLAWAGHSRAAENPAVIPLSYFGLHIHRADQGTPWPNVPFGSWRLWDAYVTWADIQPTSDRWDFERLDRYVALAKRHGVEILLPLANTPRWAASRPDELSGYKPGNASEPRQIEDWRRYVRTVAERYRGSIRDFEIWNEPNIKHHYSGSMQKLVELACEASRIVKSVDPANRIVSPGASAGAKGHVAYLDEFLSAGGSACVDIVAHHFYVPNSPPEAMIPLIRQVRSVMLKHRLQDRPLWNTETGWWIGSGDGTPDHPTFAKGGWKKVADAGESGDYVRRALLLAWSEGVGKFFWYSWDHQLGLGLIEPRSKAPKLMTESWRDLVQQLVGGSRLRCNESAGRWRCEFLDKSGRVVEFTWLAP